MVHGPPSGAVRHRPPRQVPLQQSAPEPHEAPIAWQQRPPVQLPLQHSAVSVHACCGARQHVPPVVQRPVQHWALAVHAVPPARQVHIVPVHSVEQQSAPSAQVPPLGAQHRPPVQTPPQHCEPFTQLCPLGRQQRPAGHEAPEQQSDADAHVAPSKPQHVPLIQEKLTQQPPPEHAPPAPMQLHWLGIVRPHVCPAVQPPQSVVRETPQLSLAVIVPHCAPTRRQSSADVSA